MTLLQDIIGRGTHAARPAFGTAGRLYYETDTQTLFRDSGTAWDNVEAAGSSGTFSGEVQGTDFKATGLTGATAASRYVGATASGAPTSGTFAVGDYTIDQTGKLWVCTTAGTPGTWTQVSGGGGGGGTNGAAAVTAPPLLSTWTANNIGSATAADDTSAITLSVPAESASNIRGYEKAAPGSTPWTITACFEHTGPNIQYQYHGLYLRDSVGAKALTFILLADPTNITGVWGLRIDQWTNSTTFSSAGTATACPHPARLWLKIRDDGTNRHYSFSLEGRQFVEVLSHARTTWMTPDKVGFMAHPINASWPCNISLVSWVVS